MDAVDEGVVARGRLIGDEDGLAADEDRGRDEEATVDRVFAWDDFAEDDAVGGARWRVDFLADDLTTVSSTWLTSSSSSASLVDLRAR